MIGVYMNKPFMILGGSIGQINAIKTAKKLGKKTLVLDKNPNAIGKYVSDYFELIDITHYFVLYRNEQIHNLTTQQS
jgi:heterodisulfide reductase subunit A-like polyferredoxin